MSPFRLSSLLTASRRAVSGVSSTEFHASRIYYKTDANILGAVHGGRILSFIDESGYTLANRFFYDKPRQFHNHDIVLARMENINFHSPVNINEFVDTEARVLFASPHSIYIKVDVTGTCMITTDRTLKCSAFLWYVPVEIDLKNTEKPLTALEINKKWPVEKDLHDKYHKIYTEQKDFRAKNEDQNTIFQNWQRYRSNAPNFDGEERTVEHSFTNFTRYVNARECTAHDLMIAGNLLHYIDEVAAVASGRHSNWPTVTAQIESFNLYYPAIMGDIINIQGRVIFSSKYSAYVQTLVFAENVKTQKWRLICHAIFKFVSINVMGERGQIPELVIKNEYEQKLFDESMQKYLLDKKNREKLKK